MNLIPWQITKNEKLYFKAKYDSTINLPGTQENKTLKHTGLSWIMKIRQTNVYLVLDY